MSKNFPINKLFNPASIAIVGARSGITKPGGRCLAYLKRFGYAGRVFPVNPKYDEVDGLRCYPNLSDLPEPPELVLLIVAAASVPAELEKAGAAGTRAAVVFSSGFGETGEAGQVLQSKIDVIARRHGMAVLGPNCLGLLDLHSGVIASFSTALTVEVDFSNGPAAFISQSGAMGMAGFVLAQREGARVGKFISTGNEAALGLTDFVDHFTDDASVSLVLGYVEGLQDGRRFVDAARRARRAGKAVGVLKVGRSQAGEMAARSHTGALSGSAMAYDAAFRRAGVLCADTLQDLVDLVVISPGARSANSRRVGIVSMSGGAGVMMSDACSTVGLEVVALAAPTVAALDRVLPEYTSRANPVDVGAVYDDLEAVFACIEAVAADPGVSQLLVFFGMSPLLLGRTEERFAALQRSLGKPVVIAWSAGPPEAIRALREAGVPAFDDPTRAVRAAAALANYGTPLTGPELDFGDDASGPAAQATRDALRGYIQEGRAALSEREVKALLGLYGVPVVRELLVRSPQEALDAARTLGGGPLALKAEAPDLLHKSDVGAVLLNVGAADAGAAYEQVVKAAATVVGRDGVRGALLQPMARPGVEFLAGIRYDPQFGPTITVGLGGLMSEVLADVTTELAPIDIECARAMLARLKGSRLLAPFRGAKARDIDAFAQALVALSRFAVDAGPLVAELDLNPIIVHEVCMGCTVVDAAAVLGGDG